jgi:hypothetical protein
MSVQDNITAHMDQLTMVEYFDEPALKNFLFRTEKATNGVLQKFLPSRGDQHSVIRATWSPQLCLLDRRINENRLKDRTIPAALRCVTFEGPDHLSYSAPLAGSSPATQLQQLCNNIVEHVFQVSNQRISRMVMTFKVAENNMIWLLWCSSLRMAKSVVTNQPNTPMNLDPPFQVGYTHAPIRHPVLVNIRSCALFVHKRIFCLPDKNCASCLQSCVKYLI